MLQNVLTRAGDLYQFLTENEMVRKVVLNTVAGVTSYYGMKWAFNAFTSTLKTKGQAEKQHLKVSLTKHEMTIAAQLIDPESITESWQDIAGLDEIIKELQGCVLLPIQQRDLLPGSKFFQPPKGVLLCGPPGCGKTMIAKAVAKASGFHFINLQPSTLTDVWFGESEKLTAAVFSLAAKIQPCIIFIDEIDSFLRTRSSSDGETIAMMKAQFLSLWDGLQKSGQVMVMGATNRPEDIDPAILRRMPATFQIGLPNTRQRQEILQLMLTGEDVSSTIDLKEVAEQAEGCSGSDLGEICRNAVTRTVQNYQEKKQMRQSCQQQTNGQCDQSPVEEESLQPVTQEDLLFALSKLKASKQTTSSAVPCWLQQKKKKLVCRPRKRKYIPLYIKQALTLLRSLPIN